MKRLLASALGALALAFVNGEVRAQDSKESKLPVTNQVMKDTGRAPMILEGGSCDNGNCYNGNGNGNGGGHAVGGFGLYFIQPNFETNPIGRIGQGTVNPVTGQTFTRNRQTDFRYDADVAPTFWLGYVGESGLGARMRYFEFAHGAGDNFAVPAAVAPNFTTVVSAQPLGVGIFSFGGGDRIAASSRLNVLTWDFEVTQNWDLGCWSLEGAAGLRYAHMAQHYNVSDVQTIPGIVGAGGTLTSVLTSSHNFNGAGPTVALEARRKLGDGGLGLYSNARGAILFGSAHQQVFFSSQPFVGGPANTTDAFAHQSDVIPIGELELGVDFGRNMGRATAMVQLGFVGSVWFGGGNASATGLTNFAAGADNSSNFGFVGVVLRAGVTY